MAHWVSGLWAIHRFIDFGQKIVPFSIHSALLCKFLTQLSKLQPYCTAYRAFRLYVRAKSRIYLRKVAFCTYHLQKWWCQIFVAHSRRDRNDFAFQISFLICQICPMHIVGVVYFEGFYQKLRFRPFSATFFCLFLWAKSANFGDLVRGVEITSVSGRQWWWRKWIIKNTTKTIHAIIFGQHFLAIKIGRVMRLNN